jgi:hypothetical protein
MEKVKVAWTVDGKPEYYTGRDGEPRVFENRYEAEELLLQEGIPAGDLEYLNFIEVAA